MSASVELLQRFRDAARRLLGLHLDEGRDDVLLGVIERRASARRETADHYVRGLPVATADEVHALASELTVGETFFFRHAEQLRALTEVVLPERAAARAGEKVRLLSAGCASGEEPYSLAILLREAGLEIGPGSVRAVDANPAALARAERATYSSWALRETPERSAARWFRTVGKDHVVDDSIRAAVRFELRNLLDAQADLGTPASYDVIFCRNVLMYLTYDAMRAIVSKFASLLVPGGYLFLGHAETLRNVSTQYELMQAEGAFYYRLANAPAMRAPFGPPPSEPLAASWPETIRVASERVRDLTEHAARVADAVRPGPDLAAVMELARAERFSDALEALGPRDLGPRDEARPDALLLRAVLLTQHGALGDAEEVCTHLLALDGTNAGAHYLLALCREAAGDVDGATRHDEMAAHLDPAFAMPRLHLGVTARRHGRHDAARRELQRAIELLQREDPARILLFGGGFAREGLLALCRSELRAAGGAA